MSAERTATVEAQGVTVDLLCWRHYRRRSRRTTALVLDANPGLSALALRSSDLSLPIGTVVRLPALPDEPAIQPTTLWD